MLEDLGNLGDFVGGIAVVVTLVYLALQIRQNTAALRAASRQEVVAAMRQHVAFRLEHCPNGAYIDGLRLYPDLPPEQADAFAAVLADHALLIQGSFALYDTGSLEAETWHAYLDNFASEVSTPGGAVWWEAVGRPIFVPRMVQAVDDRLAAGGVRDVLTLAETLDETRERLRPGAPAGAP